MSDLYLVLRSRLADVAEWLHVGEDVMRSARNARGLSVESTARQLHIASKTYERHEKRGRIPRHRVSDYARVLGLEITEPERQPVALPQGAVTLEDLLAEVQRQGRILERLEAEIFGEQPRPSTRPRLKRAQGE